jgi:hypothetical protein
LARADGDATTAEAKFRAGKELLAQKDYAQACPMLADSYRLDPATGALLALALCHEKQGKFATAYREYTEVVDRSKRESRLDRESGARDKARALESQMSLLTIAITPEARGIHGLEIKRNGAIVEATTWDKAIPVDGGSQLIEASAPGMQPWRAKVSVAAKQDLQSVAIPVLQEVPSPLKPAVVAAPVAAADDEAPTVPTREAAAPTASAPDAATDSDEHDTRSVRGSTLQGAGIATAAAGVVSVAIGTGFLLRAIAKNKDSKAGCVGNLCTAQGTEDRWEARDSGVGATISFAAGGALVAGGVAMYFLGRPRRALSACARTTCVEAVPFAGAGELGGVVRGTFW